MTTKNALGLLAAVLVLGVSSTAQAEMTAQRRQANINAVTKFMKQQCPRLFKAVAHDPSSVRFISYGALKFTTGPDPAVYLPMVVRAKNAFGALVLTETDCIYLNDKFAIGFKPDGTLPDSLL